MQKIRKPCNQLQVTLQEARNNKQGHKKHHYKTGVHRWRFFRRIALSAGEKLLKQENGTHPEKQEADGGAGEMESLQYVQRRVYQEVAEDTAVAGNDMVGDRAC